MSVNLVMAEQLLGFRFQWNAFGGTDTETGERKACGGSLFILHPDAYTAKEHNNLCSFKRQYKSHHEDPIYHLSWHGTVVPKNINLDWDDDVTEYCGALKPRKKFLVRKSVTCTHLIFAGINQYDTCNINSHDYVVYYDHRIEMSLDGKLLTLTANMSSPSQELYGENQYTLEIDWTTSRYHWTKVVRSTSHGKTTIKTTTGNTSFVTYWCATGISRFDYRDIIEELKSNFLLWRKNLHRSFYDPERPHNADAANRGDVFQEAVNTYKYIDSNMIAFLSELGEAGETVPTLLSDLGKLLTSGDIKHLADAWLTYRYGDFLTIDDVSSIQDAMRNIWVMSHKTGPRRTHAKKKVKFDYFSHNFFSSKRIEVERVYSLLLICEEDLQAWNYWYDRLYNYGILPTMANAWDLVPFSFIVDWFIDVGQAAENMDSLARYQTLKYKTILRGTRSTIYSCDVSRIAANFIGNVTVRSYRREYSGIDWPVYDLDHSLKHPTPKNFLDGVSLIVAK